MTKWILLAGAIICEVAATLSLKAALDRPMFYALVVVGYVSTFAFLAAVLRRGMALGVAYGIWGALGVASTAVLSSVIFDEALTVTMGIGIAVIMVGVLVVEVGSQKAQQREAVL